MLESQPPMNCFASRSGVDHPTVRHTNNISIWQNGNMSGSISAAGADCLPTVQLLPNTCTVVSIIIETFSDLVILYLNNYMFENVGHLSGHC